MDSSSKRVTHGRAAALLLLAVVACSRTKPAVVEPDHAKTKLGDAAAGRVVAGHIRGRFEVNRNGAATYNIPLKTPPGIQSIEPRLAIAYSSQGDNGTLGAGFRLSGLSAIRRCKAIIAIDQFAGTVSYDGNDRFCLDGQRLNNIAGGDYQSPDAVYHTEREQWSKIVPSHQGCAQGPCSFTVTTSQGIVMHYGTTASSRIFAHGGAAVREWALARVQDLHGNQLDIEYQTDPIDPATGQPISSPGAYYPKTISYTANPAAKFAANRFVDFTWQARPDVMVDYIGGHVVTTAARLSRVTTRIGSDVVTDYRLIYEASAAPGTGRSRLSALRECNGTGTDATCLTDTVFRKWQNQGAAFEARAAIAPGSFTASQGWGDESRYPRTSADVNGDGRMDLVGFGDANGGSGFSGVQVALCTGSRCAPAAPWTSAFTIDANIWLDQHRTPRFLTDVNADGMADVLGFGSDGVRVGLSTQKAFDTKRWNGGQPFTPFNLADWDPSLYPRAIADVDGDQLIDLVGFKNGVQVALSSSGTGFQSLAGWFSGDFSYEFGWTDLTPRIMADVNGDGRSDVVGFGLDGVKVALSTGSAFSTSGWSQSYAYYGYDQGWDPQLHPRMVGDVNGDGLADLIGLRNGVQVGLSTGKGFLPPAAWNCGFSFESGSCADPISGRRQWTQEMARQLTDVNGDGRLDLVAFNALGDGTGKVVVGLSGGTPQAGFLTGTWNQGSLPNLNPNSNPVMLADVNGDGLTDALNFADDGAYAGLVAGPIPDLLSQFSDGLGARYTIQYAPLSVGAPLYEDDDTQSTDPARVSAQAHSTFNAPMGSAVIPVYTMRRIAGDRMAVVASYTADNDPAVNAGAYAYTYNYRYKNAAVNLLGRGWLGFSQVAVADVAAGTTTVRRYNQAFPWTGTVAQKITQCNAGATYDPLCKTDGSALRSASYAYLCQTGNCTGQDLKTYNPYPGVYQVLRVSELDAYYTYGDLDFTLGTTKAYDSFGNVTLVSDLGYVTPQGKDVSPKDNVYSHSSYINDPDQQQIGRLTGRLVSSRSLGNAWSGASCSAPAAAFDPATDFSLEARDYAPNTWDTASDCRWDATNKSWLPTRYGYDPAFGNRTTVTASNGSVTTTTYEPTFQTYRNSLTTPANAAGKQYTMYFGYDPRFGTRVAHTDFNGNTFLRCNDDFGRVTTTQGPGPSASTPGSTNCLADASVTGTRDFASAKVVTLASQTWLSDGNGGIYHESQTLGNWPTEQVPSPPPIISRSYVDGLHREVKVVVTDAPDHKAAYRCTQWNSRNLRERQSVPFFASESPDCSSVSQPGTTYRYDAYGRTVQMDIPAGADGSSQSVTTYSYRGTSRGDTVVETKAARDSYAYQRVLDHAYFNGKRRTISLVIPTDGNAKTTYRYDALGRSVAQIDPAGATTTTRYDSLGRKQQTASSASGTTTYSYDPVTGWLAQRVSSASTDAYSYDPWGRVLKKTASANGKTMVASYGYDDPAAGSGIDRLTSATLLGTDGRPQSATTYGYDAYGSRTATRLTVAGQQFTSGQVYDPLRRQVALQYPGDAGETLTTDYQGLRLQRIRIDDVTYATYGNYTPFGMPEQVQFGNGVSARLDYGVTGTLQEQTVLDAEQKPVFAQELEWDHLGQLTSIVDGLTKDKQSFAYESRRMTSAHTGQDGDAYSYSYSSNGNLLAKGGLTLKYDGQRVVAASQAGRTVWSAQYDGAGRIVSKRREKDGYEYVYDPMGRLASAKGPSGTTEFTYDTEGRRLVKLDPDGTRTIYVSPYFEQVRFADGTSQSTQYIVAPTGRVAAKTTASGKAEASVPGVPAKGTFYLHTSYLDSTTLTTDARGQVASTTTYDPYGSVLSIEGNRGFRYRYTAKEADNTGLYYYGARYYDPFVARFISPDPGLGAHPYRQDALNRYAYALGSPVTYNDPTGRLSTSSAVGCVMGAISGISMIGGFVSIGVEGAGPVGATFAAVGTIGTVGGLGVCAWDIYKAFRAGAAAAPGDGAPPPDDGGGAPPPDGGGGLPPPDDGGGALPPDGGGLPPPDGHGAPPPDGGGAPDNSGPADSDISSSSSDDTFYSAQSQFSADEEVSDGALASASSGANDAQGVGFAVSHASEAPTSESVLTVESGADAAESVASSVIAADTSAESATTTTATVAAVSESATSAALAVDGATLAAASGATTAAAAATGAEGAAVAVTTAAASETATEVVGAIIASILAAL